MVTERSMKSQAAIVDRRILMFQMAEMVATKKIDYDCLAMIEIVF